MPDMLFLRQWKRQEVFFRKRVVSPANPVRLSALILPFKVILFMSHSRPMGPHSCGATSKIRPPLGLTILLELEGVIKSQGIQEFLASEEQSLDAGIPYGRRLLYGAGRVSPSAYIGPIDLLSTYSTHHVFRRLLT